MNQGAERELRGGDHDAHRRYAGLLLPWPLLGLGIWCLYHVSGPADEGFGAGGYASALFTLCYGLALYSLNRAVLNARAGSLALRAVALALFAVGVIGAFPVLFFIYLGLPYSIPGAALTIMALFRWR